MDIMPTDPTEALRAQVAHLNALLDQVEKWRLRALEHVGEDGLIDQHRFIALGTALTGRSAALSAETIRTDIEYDVIISTPRGDISTSFGTGQTETYAALRMRANEGRNPRRMSRTVNTITTGWVEA